MGASMPGFVPASFPAVSPQERIVETARAQGRILYPPEKPDDPAEADDELPALKV